VRAEEAKKAKEGLQKDWVKVKMVKVRTSIGDEKVVR
jgi:hypothetical protein